MYLFIYLCIYLFIYVFIHSLTHLFIYTFIGLFHLSIFQLFALFLYFQHFHFSICLVSTFINSVNLYTFMNLYHSKAMLN